MTAMFEDLASIAPLSARGEDRFDFVMPDGWQQGRGTFGGLVLGLLVRAVETLEPASERPLRTLNATLGAALKPGPAEIQVTLRRRGRALSSFSAQMFQGGQVVAEALTIHGLARTHESMPGELRAPDIPPWAELPVAPMGPPVAPVFTQHFEYRNVGPVPFVGGPEAVAAGWVRPRVRRRMHDAAELIALTDAWWPAPFACTTGPRPMATVAFQWSQYGAAAGDEPLFHTGRVLAAADGFFTEERVLFSESGTLVALNQQTFAVD